MAKLIFKRCVHCGEVKPASEFNKHSNTKDGLQPWCQKCQREYMREFNKKQTEKKSNEKQSNLPITLGNCEAYLGSDGEVCYSINGNEIAQQDMDDLLWIIRRIDIDPAS